MYKFPKATKPIQGEIYVPSDKSISHRALILASLAKTPVCIKNLLLSEDTKRTLQAMKLLGAEIDILEHEIIINGPKLGFINPASSLDMGNSGTSARLLMGLISSYNLSACFIGDESLSRRPMVALLKYLGQFGAQASHNFLPTTLQGKESKGQVFDVKEGSSQIKTALILASMNLEGKSQIIENTRSRDHLENLLEYFDYKISRAQTGVSNIEIEGRSSLEMDELEIPGDPSSAAFLATLALMIPGSNILLKHILLNPFRIGFYEILKKMGANINYHNVSQAYGELVGDIEVSYSELRPLEIGSENYPLMTDEYPLLALICALTEGQTHIKNLSGLRTKESDRLQAIYEALFSLGANIRMEDDGLIIEGKEGSLNKTAMINTRMDHRIAMSFLVASLMGLQVEIDDISMIETSFPGFISTISKLLGTNLIKL